MRESTLQLEVASSQVETQIFRRLATREEALPREVELSSRIAERLTITEARDLLDWLEANHIKDPVLTVDESGLFTVTWIV